MGTEKKHMSSATEVQHTSTVWVHCSEASNSRSTLMHYHEKLGIWLPPGGKVEPNETRFEAALRELNEETGLSPEHVSFMSGAVATGEVVQPFCTSDLPHLNAVDFGYLALLKDDMIHVPGFEWIEDEDVWSLETNDNVKELTLLSFNLLRNKVT